MNFVFRLPLHYLYDESLRYLRSLRKIFKQVWWAQASDPINRFADPITEQLYQAIMNDGTLSYAAYGEQIGVSEATIKRRLGELKKSGLIVRVGSNKNGHWEVL